ncbi:MAG: hypothetical protein JW715_01605 [Sedimentisphaerales bacterium]|nr:hypothetical protein [Sedimentisphaerales bacterium]
MARNNYKVHIGIFFISLAIIIGSHSALGFPTDNAAVLYLRAFIVYEEPDNENLSKMITDLQDGKIKPNDQIRQYLEKNRTVIELVTTASQIPDCDWGRDHSKGFDLMMPELATVRKLAFMLVADSKVYLNDGDYKTSLERCITIHRMARHISDDLIISNLVGIAMHSLANKHIKIILSEMPADVEVLEWLKNQMLEISGKSPSLISAIKSEAEISAREMRKENVNKLLDYVNTEDIKVVRKADADITPSEGRAEEKKKKVYEENVEKLRNGDEEYFSQSRKYYMDFISSVKAAFALPYEDAYRELEKLNETITKDADTNPTAFLTSHMSPMISKLCTNEMVFKTNFNAVNAAIEIYILKAKTGKLPDKLPEGLPKDLFSGKDFIYEKTGDGFVLKCQGKDLQKEKIHEYEFKVKNLN